MNRKYLTVFLWAIAGIIIDQTSKFIVKSNFELNQSVKLIKNIFHLTYLNNSGAGFGILQQQNTILIFISIAVIGIIFYYLSVIKDNELYAQILCSLILSGTIGNLIDRISYGYVIDFLDFRIWPVFNFADAFVTIGVFGLVIYLWNK